jgi:hypothetical protein
VTLEEFADVFAKLALQLHATDADAPTIRAYHQALADLEIEVVREAAHRLARHVNEDGHAWFPKSGEWRVEAVRVYGEWTEQQRAQLRRLPTPLCPHCDDTGWKKVWSTGRFKPCDCRTTRHLELLGRVAPPQQLTGRTNDDGERALSVPNPN